MQTKEYGQGKDVYALDELVSIVVPVYNVFAYLGECISSILKQTYQNIEVILVDDGSTDGSSTICKKYQDLDPRVKLISQENQGVVCARKNGANAASGNYISFVDADDYVDIDLYQRFMECKGNFDLVISQWFRESNGQVRRTQERIGLGAYQTEDDMNFLFDHLISVASAGGTATIRPGLHTGMCQKLYKTNLVRTVFDSVDTSIGFGEDAEFIFRYILQCNSVLVTDICGYHYRKRDTSVTQIKDNGELYLANYSKLYRALYPVFQAHPRCDTLIPQLQFKIFRALGNTPQRMGFAPAAQNRAVVFPFLNLLNEKSIVLYGCGRLGQTYQRQILQFNICKIVLWTGEEWAYHQREGWAVSPLEKISETIYDYAVIAAETEEEAASNIEMLVAMGVERTKILWRKPLMLET